MKRQFLSAVVRVGVFVLVGFDCVKSQVGTDCLHMLSSNEAWHRLFQILVFILPQNQTAAIKQFSFVVWPRRQRREQNG